MEARRLVLGRDESTIQACRLVATHRSLFHGGVGGTALVLIPIGHNGVRTVAAAEGGCPENGAASRGSSAESSLEALVSVPPLGVRGGRRVL